MLKPSKGAFLNRVHPFARGLAGRWLFNEGNGEFANDLAWGNDGNANPTMQSDDWVATPDGWGIDFNGSDNFVDMGADPSLQVGTKPFAIDALIYCRAGNPVTNNTIAARRESFAALQYSLSVVTATGKLNLLTYDGTISQVTGNVDVRNTWRRVLGQRLEDGTLELYIDGELDISSPQTIRDITLNGEFTVGKNSTQNLNFFDGIIADTALYIERSFTVGEVAQLHRDPYQMIGREFSPAVFGALALLPIFRRRIEGY